MEGISNRREILFFRRKKKKKKGSCLVKTTWKTKKTCSFFHFRKVFRRIARREQALIGILNEKKEKKGKASRLFYGQKIQLHAPPSDDFLLEQELCKSISTLEKGKMKKKKEMLS